MTVLTLTNHYYIEGLGLVPKVKSLFRDDVNRRWMVTPSNDNGHYLGTFSDVQYNNSANSYRAAVKMLKRISPVYKPRSVTRLKERSDKQVPLNHPGIMLKKTPTANGVKYYFIIHNPVKYKLERVDIGNEITVMDNWIDSLSVAKAIRSSFEYGKRRKNKLSPKDNQLVVSL